MYIALILLCVVVKEHRRWHGRACAPPSPLQNLMRPARQKMVGVTGFEPVTLRLSSACSNQLSYTPLKLRERSSRLRQVGGAEESRTPDTLLAKQVLYH